MRRLGTSLAFAAAVALGPAGTARAALCPDHEPPPCPPGVHCVQTQGPGDRQALQADGLVDSMGVQTHLAEAPSNYTGGVRGQFNRDWTIPNVALLRLGIRHIRDRMPDDVAADGPYFRELKALAAHGIKLATFLPQPPLLTVRTFADLATLARAGIADTVEPVNESDFWWPDYRGIAAAQRQLHAHGRAHGLRVLGPSLADPRRYGSFSDTGIERYVDAANLHIYGAGLRAAEAYTLDDSLRPVAACATQASGNAPIVVTESGWATTRGGALTEWTVDEDSQAAYLPRVFLTNYAAGVIRTYAYELLDEQPFQVGFLGHFGIADAAGRPKPAFTALRTLIELLADPGPAFRPGRLRYSLETDRPRQLRSMLLQKRSGAFWLALWQDVRLWEPGGQVAVQPRPRPAAVTISLSRRVRRRAEVHHLRSGSAPARRLRLARVHRVTVPPDDAVLVRLGTEKRNKPAKRRK